MYVCVHVYSVSRVFAAWILHFCKASLGVILTAQLEGSCCFVKQRYFTVT